MQERLQPRDVGAERLQPACMHLVDATLRNDKRALPVVVAVQHDEDASGIDMAEDLSGIARMLRQPQPQHVHRCTAIDHLEAGGIAQRGMPAVTGDDKLGANVQRAIGTTRGHADHGVAFTDQVDRVGLHQQPERGKALRLIREEIEEIPLRHEGNELRLRWQM